VVRLDVEVKRSVFAVFNKNLKGEKFMPKSNSNTLTNSTDD